MVSFKRSDDSAHAGRRQPPPNYFSRAVRLKIFLLLGLFMGVLMLASEARKPENWRWMWAFDQNVSTAATPDHLAPGAGEAGPTPLAPALSRGRRQSEPDSEPIVAGIEPPALPPDRDATQPLAAVPPQRDGWNHVLRRLSKTQRQLFQTGLWSWRHHRSLDGASKAEWPALLERVDGLWADYLERVRTAVTRGPNALTETQKQASLAIIEATESLWGEQKTALETLADEELVGGEQDKILVQLQAILDQRAWAQVKDNTVLRSAETDAWYRCWDQFELTATRARIEAAPRATFVQLFAQPSEFRGRLVKVSGIVKSAYHVTSRTTRFGIDGYVVLGLLPRDHSGSPIVIYCTELPAGFPKIDAGDPSGSGVSLNEEVEITGYFFKRWLHRSLEGMTLSPLILGKVTDWKRRAAPSQAAAHPPITRGVLLVSAVVMALLAALIAVSVYRGSRWSSTDTARSTRAPDALPTFPADEVHGGVAQRLSELAEEIKRQD